MSQETFTDMTICDLQKKLRAAESKSTDWQKAYKENREFLLKLLEIFAVDGKPDRSSVIADWRQHASDLKHAYNKLAEIEAIEAERDALREEVARLRKALTFIALRDNQPLHDAIPTPAEPANAPEGERYGVAVDPDEWDGMEKLFKSAPTEKADLSVEGKKRYWIESSGYDPEQGRISDPMLEEQAEPTSDLDRFQAEVGEWGKATFPKSTIYTIAKHFEEEAHEFVDATGYPECEDDVEERLLQEADIEAADCFLLLLHYCHRRGVSLLELAREKHRINRDKRQWGEPDENGVVHHVKGEEES